MNLDTRRLKEIQQLKQGYLCKIEESENMQDMFHYMDKINELEIEETEILDRLGVEI